MSCLIHHRLSDTLKDFSELEQCAFRLGKDVHSKLRHSNLRDSKKMPLIKSGVRKHVMGNLQPMASRREKMSFSGFGWYIYQLPYVYKVFRIHNICMYIVYIYHTYHTYFYSIIYHHLRMLPWHRISEVHQVRNRFNTSDSYPGGFQKWGYPNS